MPHGNFDDKLTLNSGGDGLEACGPINWKGIPPEPPAQGLRVMEVTIRQGKKVCAGQLATRDIKPPATEWMIELHFPAGVKLKRGPAQASAQVLVMEEGRNVQEPWERTVELI